MKERTGSDLPAHSRKIAALAVLGGASLTVGVYLQTGVPLRRPGRVGRSSFVRPRPKRRVAGLHAHAEIAEPAEHRPLRAPSLSRQYKRISTQDYRDGRKDNSRCKLRDLFYFRCGLLLAWRRC